MALTKRDREWVQDTIQSVIQDHLPGRDYFMSTDDYEDSEVELPRKHGNLWSRADDHQVEASFRKWVREEAVLRQRTETSVISRLFHLNIIPNNLY